MQDGNASFKKPFPKIKDKVLPLINQAIRHYETGNQTEAASICRHILSVYPEQPDALHIIGVIAYESGDFSKALQYLQNAILIQPDHFSFFISIGDVYRAIDDDMNAFKAYQRAIQIDRTASDAHFRIGLLHEKASDLDLAVQCYEQAIQYQSNYFEAHFNLGCIYLEREAYQQALFSFQKVIGIQPKFSKAYYFSGVASYHLNQLQSAISYFQKTVKFDAQNAAAFYNMAIALEESEYTKSAKNAYENAIAINAEYWEAYYNLANIEKRWGNGKRAIELYNQAIRLHPGLFQAYNNMALIYKEEGKLHLSAELLKKALSIEPLCVEALYNMGLIHQIEGEIEIARSYYQKALKIDPYYTPAKWLRALSLPILYDDEDEMEQTRLKFEHNLDRLMEETVLETESDKKNALKGTAEVTNFYLQYQGKNDVILQKKYGSFVRKIMEANFPRWTKEKEMPAIMNGDKIRIGYISSFMYAHTVGDFLKGWLQAHSKEQFEIFCYYVGTKTDPVTHIIHRSADHFTQLSGSVEKIAEKIDGDMLHVLVYTDIGMNAITTQLAALNLAPVQCKGWGHPVTTGIPSIDYYLSSDLMEPPDANEHYSEYLVRLPNLALFYSPPKLPPPENMREKYGLKEANVIYLSTQSLFKYLPQYDDIYPRIAKELSSARFIFIENRSKKITTHFQNRMQRAFSSYRMEWDQWIQMVPPLSFGDFLNLNLSADIFLDTFEWSGGKTSLEALSCGLPVVTCPGSQMRGRHTFAFLKRMGLYETIATNKDDYVAIAIKLGRELPFRENIKMHILSHRNTLYNDTVFMKWLENFYRSIVFQHQRRFLI